MVVGYLAGLAPPSSTDLSGAQLGVASILVIAAAAIIVALWRFALRLLDKMHADQKAFLDAINAQTEAMKDFRDLVSDVVRRESHRGGGT